MSANELQIWPVDIKDFDFRHKRGGFHDEELRNNLGDESDSRTCPVSKKGSPGIYQELVGSRTLKPRVQFRDL